jgi:hypothetical protein
MLEGVLSAAALPLARATVRAQAESSAQTAKAVNLLGQHLSCSLAVAVLAIPAAHAHRASTGRVFRLCATQPRVKV